MASKDDIIAELRRIVDAQAKQIAAQAKQIVAQAKRIDELELKLAKAFKDSSNSSKSPSSDIVKPPPKKQSAVGKRKKAKRGGQKGRKRKLREPLPPERVDQQITYEINDADVRELDLTPTEQFEIVQHVELLDMPIHVTEHRLRTYVNPDGETFLPYVLELRNQPIFGPRMLAMIGWLKSRAHCSYSTIAIWMDDVLQVPVSRGYLAKLCNGTISASLAAMHEQLKQAIPRQSCLGSDESSLKNNGKPRLQSKGLDLVYHRATVHFISHCHHPFAVGVGRTDRHGLWRNRPLCHRTIFALCSNRVSSRPTITVNSRCVTV